MDEKLLKSLMQDIRRYKILIYNAICVLEHEKNFENKKQLLDNLGMSKKEYKQIMRI